MIMSTVSAIIVVAVAVLLALLFWVTLAVARRLSRRADAPTKSPFECNFERFEAAVPLKHAFRFAHEPLRSDRNGRFVGRQAELEALALRILFSEGGSFLVTGYRGVGKTSFVNQVIRQLQDMLPWAESIFGETKIVDVQLNLARPLTAAELMHHIIRRLYERLAEIGIYSALTPALKHDLELAYKRTSFNMTRTLNDETEKNLGLDEIKIGPPWLSAAFKGGLSLKKKRSEGSEYEYLGYDDKAAENDVIQLSRQLSGALLQRPALVDRAMAIMGKPPKAQPTRLIMVFVFDELDKLEEFSVTRHGKTTTAIDELLSALKNVFTTSGVSFVFVAGKDTQERWLDDLGRGDSVYESVFAYDKYLPCMWSDVNALCDGFVDWDRLPQQVPKFCAHCGNTTTVDAVDCPKCGQPFPPPTIKAPSTHLVSPSKESAAPCPKCFSASKQEVFCGSCGRYLLDPRAARTVFEDFKKYLDYRGRGIPRRVIRGFNEYVLWSGQHPILVFSKQDVRRIRVYSELQDVLVRSEQRLFGKLDEEIRGTQQDKRRLGVYYLVDWILRQGNTEFTIKDAVAASKRLSAKIAPAEEIAFNIISDIVAVLIEGDFLIEVEQRLDQVQIGDVNARQEKRYKLAPRRLIEMRGEGDAFEAESQALRQVAAQPDRIAHYQLTEQIGAGGMGAVYRAWDEQSGQTVAIKILPREFGQDPQARERFKRESAIMNRLRHQNIVKCYETGEDNGSLYIAMEYIDGIDLAKVLKSVGLMSLGAAVSVARSIAEALSYVHGQGLVRHDIKPANVMLSKSGNVYLMDFGITKHVESPGADAVTFAGAIIGTPSYMSPEQCQGLTADERSDIYSFGILFYELLTGEPPFKGDSVPDIMLANINRKPQPPSELVASVPVPLESIVLRCLQKAPADRFQKVEELLKDLAEVTRDIAPANIAQLVGSVSNIIQRIADDLQADTMPEAPSPFVDPTVPPPPLPPPMPVAQVGFTTAQMDGAPVRAASTMERSLPRLEIMSPDYPERVFALGPGRTTLGRAPLNDVALNNEPRASRFHAAIDFREGDYYLSDLNTANGTTLNDRRVTEPMILHDRDRIQIGDVVLEFRLP
jgi:serine/threonine protein kinase/Cdc6-like AAA superfamily ATPase